jgi:[acyl-carrier-protein] S-malonyltransferase
MRIGMLFPGQGAQRPGMGLPWVDRPGWAVVEHASQVTGRDVAALLLEADAQTLRRTDNAQLATFVLELVILAELGDAVRPAACAGHSLGECAALVGAGIMTPEDGLRLVVARGSAMRAAATAEPGTMAAILGLTADQVTELTAELRDTGERVWAANFNAPGHIVVSGTATGVARCGEAALERGALRVVALEVGGAFHSPLMSAALAPLDAALRTVSFAPAPIPVVANVDAVPRLGGPGWRNTLLQQVISPVRWSETVPVLTGPLGCDLLLEIGPGRTLTGLAKRLAPDTPRLSVAAPEHIPALVP